jgi:hypothetical protein
MSRIARLTVPHVLHHVISRFVDRDWFFASDVERARYLALLGRALSKTDWRCVAYCLMSNHIHLALVGGEAPLESWAKKVNSPFARWMNERHGRLGPVFADRPAVYLVPSHREAEVIAYIHNNPVRARVVQSALSSSWSSHRAYVGRAQPPAWLDVRVGLERAGCPAAPDAFERLVNSSVEATLELPDLGRVRARIRREGAYEIGTPTLSKPVEVPVVCRRILQLRPSAPALLELVAAAAGVPATAATRRHARGTPSVVKRVFVHAAVQVGVSIAAASATLNVSRQRGSAIAGSPLSSMERALLDVIVARTRTEGTQSCQS